MQLKNIMACPTRHMRSLSDLHSGEQESQRVVITDLLLGSHVYVNKTMAEMIEESNVMLQGVFPLHSEAAPMRLRSALNRREKLGYNRHARKAVREYYGLAANAIIANQLIDWKNGDTVGTLEKRNAWRERVWADWNYRRGKNITATEVASQMQQHSKMFAAQMLQHQDDAFRYIFEAGMKHIVRTVHGVNPADIGV